MSAGFIKAKPIWINGKEEEVNCRVQFKTFCSKNQNARIRIATSGIYQLYINGEFVSYGPARAGKNHFRMEDIDISAFLNKDNNVIVIEVAGYYCSNFYVLKQKSFLTAEIVDGKDVLVATGEDFSARINPYYIRKIQRYSFQRAFAEAYRLNDNFESFFTDAEIGKNEVVVTKDKKVIERTVPYPEFESLKADYIDCGFVKKIIPETYSYDRYVLQVGFKDGETNGWKANELDCALQKDWQEMEFTPKGEENKDTEYDGHYSVYKFAYNATGIINLTVECEKPVTLYLGFDEIFIDRTVNTGRERCCNIIRYELPKGRHTLNSFEVYTMKYMQVVAFGGEVKIEELKLIEYKHPFIAVPEFKDEKLSLIATAAVETYRQNAVDLFTDCPSRERAGWLCDSFFLARAEYVLTGENKVEEAFLENFLHEETYGKLPEGMVPMCYPADHDNVMFIPNWALWLVVEMLDYKKRGGKKELIERFKPKLYGILSYFKTFENSDGLLEDLKNWVFVEWSRANDSDMVQGVNYPSNMMYYAALKAVSQLYGDATLEAKAEKLKAKINEQSFGGEFFADRALRTNDGLFTIPESTEVCQYYAFFCGIADKTSHPKLFDTLINKFGPNRDLLSTYPEVHKAAPFIGNYLRLEILKTNGYDSVVTENIKDYFYYMATTTGTLWEKADTSCSCNHGFASCVLYWML